MCVFVYGCVHRFCQRPKREADLEIVVTIQHVFCEANSGPFQEQHAVLTTKLSLQPHIWIFRCSY